MDEESVNISNENIEHLIFRSEPEELKFPMYKSKFSKLVREESRIGKDCHKTFGYATDFPKADPKKDFLKKGTRVVCRPRIEYTKPPTKVLEQVPKKGEWKIIEHKPTPNFIKLNIKKVHNAIPQTGPSRYVTTKGIRFHNCNLLIPKFVWGEKFGKVPGYIYKIKKELSDKIKEKEEKWRLRAEKYKAAETLKRVSSAERLELLNGLKTAWAGLQREFQLLPMLNDTPPKIKRKRFLEEQLNALEKEIQMIEGHQIIYVYEDPNDNTCNNKAKDICYE
ncbi:enkurin [Cimex lectularius]|uniref:Enkurin domain-containing protein n=1 Tax=Cimex lectularius TaxID=79782 RepID=A0A8I6S3E7_CIMLE|nr:enkurin [Cimex lectularius]